MIITCKHCGIDLEVDIDAFEAGEELQTTCPECGRDFVFVVKKDVNKYGSSYFYLDDNNEQKGPLSVKELVNVISGSTLVWKEGMSGWEKACEVAELSSTMKPITPPPIPVSSTAQIKASDTPQPEKVEYQPFKPDAHMAMAVLCTLFCCIPLGIVAIYYASKVDKAYYQGKYYESERYSERAKTWTYLGIGFGIASYIIYFTYL